MKFYKKPIFTGFVPNLTFGDFKKASAFLFLPWNWPKIRKGENIVKVEAWLKKYFSCKFAFVFDSGRSALYFALKSFALKPGDEVLVQAYTCMVVTNAICQAGGKPVYVDIEADTLNMDLVDLIKKITPQTKVLIIQHTFGRPAKLEELINFAKQNNLKVIEDCAHSLGVKHSNELTGNFGDIGIFSFGSDKVISCARGGALITNNDDLGNLISDYQRKLPQANILKTIQHLFHFFIFFISKPLFNLFIGKALLLFAKKVNLINKIIYPAEKKGERVAFYPSTLPNSLAFILLDQLNNLTENIKHRQKIAKIYFEQINNKNFIMLSSNDEEAIHLRFPLFIEFPERIMFLAKKEGIVLGDWYNSVVAPRGVNFSKTFYKIGSCPKAEFLAERSLNLPTDQCVTEKDAERIVGFINSQT